ncbi:unnamed protein product [Linum tenue]|uniref:Uncharacterized protein n=1 Tax=Linum tenue TaxID=586396 RepID=A0AAV0ITP8_9ROSI|nr:unnamed protein product [Linum tenue]
MDEPSPLFDLSLSLTSFLEVTKNTKKAITGGDGRHVLPAMTTTTPLKFKPRGASRSVQPQSRFDLPRQNDDDEG